jgi:hypothetical protein
MKGREASLKIGFLKAKGFVLGGVVALGVDAYPGVCSFVADLAAGFRCLVAAAA